MRRTMCRAAMTGVIASLTSSLTACGGALSADAFQWGVQLTQPAPDADLAVEFCPLAGSGLSPRFIPESNLLSFLTVADEDVYTFSTPGSGATAQVFGPSMTFDLGPIGTVYDDSAPVVLPFGNGVDGPVTVTRTLVGGSRSSDTEVALTYDLAPSCDTLTAADQTTCECVNQTVTWTFKGQ